MSRSRAEVVAGRQVRSYYNVQIALVTKGKLSELHPKQWG